MAWCTHFLRFEWQVEHQPRFCVLRDEGRCVAIVPLIVTRWRFGPVRLAVARLIGSDSGLTEIRGPLVCPGFEQETVRAVHQRLSQLEDWDWIQWSGLTEPMGVALAREAPVQWCETTEDYLIDLPADWGALRSRLTRNARESLRHCYNSLRREGHVFEFVVVRTREELPAALDRFFELHAARANMSRGPRHPNRFAGATLQAFLRDVCDRLALHDRVRVFQLKIAGRVVATRIGFVTGDCLYLYYSGFDPAWARYSVMTTTVAEAFKYSMAHGIKTINLSPVAERSKLRWRPRRVEFRSALVSRESLRSRVACMAYRMALSRRAAPLRLLRGIFWAHR